MPRVTHDRVTLAVGVRTAIVAPWDALTVLVELEDQANDCKMHDAAAAGTFKTLYRGSEYRLTLPEGTPTRKYAKGDTICWLEPVAGTGPALVSYWQ